MKAATANRPRPLLLGHRRPSGTVCAAASLLQAILVLLWLPAAGASRSDALFLANDTGGAPRVAWAEPTAPPAEMSRERPRTDGAGNAPYGASSVVPTPPSVGPWARPGRRPELGCSDLTASPWRAGVPFRAPPPSA